jgi:hypothetical protein
VTLPPASLSRYVAAQVFIIVRDVRLSGLRLHYLAPQPLHNPSGDTRHPSILASYRTKAQYLAFCRRRYTFVPVKMGLEATMIVYVASRA